MNQSILKYLYWMRVDKNKVIINGVMNCPKFSLTIGPF